MIRGKHTEEAQQIRERNETIKLKDKEIKDIKIECAEQFKRIKDLCFSNEYGGFNDERAKLRKIYEIASDNFAIILNDLLIDEEEQRKAKIIELPNTRKSNK